MHRKPQQQQQQQLWWHFSPLALLILSAVPDSLWFAAGREQDCCHCRQKSKRRREHFFNHSTPTTPWLFVCWHCRRRRRRRPLMSQRRRNLSPVLAHSLTRLTFPSISAFEYPMLAGVCVHRANLSSAVGRLSRCKAELSFSPTTTTTSPSECARQITTTSSSSSKCKSAHCPRQVEHKYHRGICVHDEVMRGWWGDWEVMVMGQIQGGKNTHWQPPISAH